MKLTVPDAVDLATDMDVEEELPILPDLKQVPYPAAHPEDVIVQFPPLLFHPLGTMPVLKVIDVGGVIGKVDVGDAGIVGVDGVVGVVPGFPPTNPVTPKLDGIPDTAGVVAEVLTFI
jgi:hypothetical protein